MNSEMAYSYGHANDHFTIVRWIWTKMTVAVITQCCANAMANAGENKTDRDEGHYTQSHSPS